MTKPLRPLEVVAAVKIAKTIPDFVIDVINKLLVENFKGEQARFTANLARERIKVVMPPNTEFQDWWLDFEDVFRESGWKVKYDSPGYCEMYNGFYLFEIKPAKDYYD